MNITDVTGAHLTAADRRNIKALLDHDYFEPGRTYTINGRKRYNLVGGPTRYAVTIGHTETDDFGRKADHVYRSEFTLT